MWLQIADAQRERRVAALADVLRSLIAQKRRLGVFLRHGRLSVAREHALAEVFRIGCKPPLDQEMVIRAKHVQPLQRGIATPIRVFAADPRRKPVLGKNLIPQVPFAHKGRLIFRRQHLGKSRHLGAQRHIARGHAGSVRPQSSQHSGPRRAAHRLAHIGVFKDKAIGSQPVERRGLNLLVAIAAQRIHALLISEDVEYVGMSHKTPYPG